MIETVYIFPGISEPTQLENAKRKATNHPEGLVNVCYHRHYESHRPECYTFDVNDIQPKEV